MKKKIINGLLLSAMLFAGATSFVSCKDNVDDVAKDIYVDLNSLKGQVDQLGSQVSQYDNSILKNSQEIESVKNQLNGLKNDLDALEGKVNKNSDDIAALQKEIDALNDAIKSLKDLLGNAVSSVIVQETNDPVIGTINTLAFNVPILGGYIGENVTGLKEFPTASSAYAVNPQPTTGNDWKLEKSEIKGDKIWSNGEGSLLLHETGNLGTIYFTLNPRNVDPTLIHVDLINSVGEVSPVEISEIQPSNHVITYAFGKHGNGLEAEITNSDKTYLYEAKATIPVEKSDEIHFFWNQWGYDNQWNESQLGGRLNFLFQEAAENPDNEGENGILKAAYRVLQDFYNGIFDQKKALTKQALRVSWADGENDVISNFGITTFVINPLGWNDMTLVDLALPSLKWKLSAAQPAVNKAAAYAGSTNTNVQQSAIRANSFLEKLSNKILAGFQNEIAWHATEPTVLLETSEGIVRLNQWLENQDGQRIQLTGANSKYTFILTSLTEEYIVPVFAKYVAVLQGGVVTEAHTLRGTEKVIGLEIPTGESELVYQAVDYKGNVVTKRYPLNRTEK